MNTTLGTPVMAESTSVNTQISTVKALQEIANRKLSGKLTIRDPNEDSIIWRVYVGKGQVHFAHSVVGQKERLTYLLQQYYPQLEPLQSSWQSDYQYICHYWQLGKLSLQQVRQVLFQVTQEAFVQILSLQQVQLGFEKIVGLDPLLLSVSLQQTVVPVQQLINQWRQLKPEIICPLQRPFIKNVEHFSQLFEDNSKFHPFKLLNQKINQKLTLYEIAHQLEVNSLDLANLLKPLIKTGIIGVDQYSAVNDEERPVIACIDDSKTVQRNVKLILEASGYKVLDIMEPARALTMLIRNKPILILMDISMPDIDGYELCRLLRQSTLLKQIPIVMLTGRDGLIDRIRARQVGATDYITKPFNPQDLVKSVHKFTNYVH